MPARHITRAAALSFLLCLVAHAATPPPSPAAVFDDLKAHATPDELHRLLFALPLGGDVHHHSGSGVPMDCVAGMSLVATGTPVHPASAPTGACSHHPAL